MANEPSRGHKNDRESQAEDRCLLCEAIIETSDHDVYFATGYCRYCHEVVEPSDQE